MTILDKFRFDQHARRAADPLTATKAIPRDIERYPAIA